MKTICLRLVTLVLLAAGLSFVSDAGIKIDAGKVLLVGRCSFAESSQSVGAAAADRLVGIAQAEFTAGPDGNAIFTVKKVFTLTADDAGFFMIKNLPANYTYIFLGVQMAKDQPLQVKHLTLANAAEKRGRVLDLGHHQISLSNGAAKSGEVTMKLVSDITVEDYMNHFIGKDSMSRFAHHVCNRTGYWGKGNTVISMDVNKVRLNGLSSATWQRISAKS